MIFFWIYSDLFGKQCICVKHCSSPDKRDSQNAADCVIGDAFKEKCNILYPVTASKWSYSSLTLLRLFPHLRLWLELVCFCSVAGFILHDCTRGLEIQRDSGYTCCSSTCDVDLALNVGINKVTFFTGLPGKQQEKSLSLHPGVHGGITDPSCSGSGSECLRCEKKQFCTFQELTNNYLFHTDCDLFLKSCDSLHPRKII